MASAFAVVLRMLYRFGCRKEDFRFQNRAEKVSKTPKGIQMGAKVSQGMSQGNMGGQAGKNNQKGSVLWYEMVPIFDKHRQKSIQRIINKTVAKIIDLYAKVVPRWMRTRWQKSSNTNAKTGNKNDLEGTLSHFCMFLIAFPVFAHT